MTYQDFIDCIKKYRNLLLEIIPDFFNEDDILNFNFKSPDERKRYFTDLKFSTDLGYYTKEYNHHYHSDKQKSELREPYIRQQKRWIKKCSGFVKEMKDILSYIDHPDLPLFRIRLFNKNDMDRNREDALDNSTALSVFMCFMSYLVGLREKGKDFSSHFGSHFTESSNSDLVNPCKVRVSEGIRTPDPQNHNLVL